MQHTLLPHRYRQGFLEGSNLQPLSPVTTFVKASGEALRYHGEFDTVLMMCAAAHHTVEWVLGFIILSTTV